MISKHVDTHMRDTLAEAIRILFPLGVEPNDIIKRHRWRTRKVLGEVAGTIAMWSGWSANLGEVSKGLRTVYIDYVPNLLPHEERCVLFGKDFAMHIQNMDSFVAMFVANFPKNKRGIIKDGDFLVREIGPKLHAAKVAETDSFLGQPSLLWAAYLARLANFQKAVLYPGIHLSSKHEDEITSAERGLWDRQQGDLEWEDEYGVLDL